MRQISTRYDIIRKILRNKILNNSLKTVLNLYFKARKFFYLFFKKLHIESS